MLDTSVLETRLAFPNRRQGKVRDLYDIASPTGVEANVLIVATDRSRPFDVVLGGGVPGKGIVLTQMARFWFECFAERVDHHLISGATWTTCPDSPAERGGERAGGS